MDIIAWWKRRQQRKRAIELVKGTRKLLRMHRDIIDARQLKYLGEVCDDLKRRAIVEDRPHLIGEFSEELERGLAKVFPHTPGASVRENIEVFLVAAIVAMAIRSFFIQPFKIPTGSMQPTLFGLHEAQDDGRNASLPRRVFDCAVLGKWPTNPQTQMPGSLMNFISWIAIGRWPFGATSTLRGDHIFVDRFTYHFRKPERGDVVVFETNDTYKELMTKAWQRISSQPLSGDASAIYKALMTKYATFSADDIRNLPEFAAELKPRLDGTYGFLYRWLSPSTLSALDAYQGGNSNPEPLRSALVRDLNRIISTQKLYREKRKELEEDHLCFNRVFLEETYGAELRLSRARELWELKNKMDNKFYIKRLVAIGGDRVRIAPPHALINGGVLNSRSAFQRIYSCENGYHGYEMPMGSGPLGEPICVGRTPNDEYDVRDKRYLVFGDNTQSSYDGRYWGAFPERCLIGRAVFVYWPFTRRFGLIE